MRLLSLADIDLVLRVAQNLEQRIAAAGPNEGVLETVLRPQIEGLKAIATAPPLTPEHESVVLDKLADAWNAYTCLPMQHPTEADEFCRLINAAQNILAVRVARRVDPVRWPTFG